MRRVAGAVLATTMCSRAAVTPSFVAVPPPAATSSSWHTAARSCSLVPVQSVRQEQDAGVKEEEEEEGTYGGDDQRRFWDTVVKVLRSELGAGDNQPDLSRVWGFVAHNREGKAPPAEPSPSYRATGLYFPGLEAKPWWDDRSELSWLQDLEDAAPDIKREMEALQRSGGARSYKGGTGEMSTVYDATRGWGTMRIRYMGRFGQPGVNYALLPRTLAALRRLPLAPETAAFQRQLPGTGLPLHVDPSNFVLGCHVGVVVPPTAAAAAAGAAGVQGSADGSADASAAAAGDRRGGKGRGGANRKKRGGGGVGFGGGGGVRREEKAAGGESGGAGSTAEGGAAERRSGTGRDGGTERRERSGERAWIEVSGEKRHWEPGRAFVFDPSFLHRTYNPTDGERVILNIDVWHPGLKEVEKTAIRRVCELVEQWNSRSGLFED